MRSNFNTRQRRIISSAQPRIDENYDLRGLNLISPDQIMPKGESPMALNCRMYARNEEETRVAIRTRRGSVVHSEPVGFAADTDNDDTITGDVPFTPVNWIAQPFAATNSGVLTQVDLWVKRLDGSAGPVIVEIYDDNSGVPGNLLAQSSVNLSQITLSYQWLPAYFIDAPALTASEDYWIVVHTQVEGQGTYHLGETVTSGALISNTSGGTWDALGASVAFKTYLATAGAPKGWTRRDPQNKQRRILLAHGTDVYAIPDNPATPTSISSAIDPTATKVRFEQIDDKTIWVDGVTPAKWYDGTNVTTIGGMSGTPTHVIAHKNRLFWVKTQEPTRVDFSGLYEFETYRSVDYFYVPNPKSPDHITAMVVFQDNLIIFTRTTKYIMTGSDIASFTMKQAVGTKGALHQEVVAVDRNYIYFMSDDSQLYRFNGVSDELISDKAQPELDSIQNLDNCHLSIHDNQLRLHYPKAPSIEVNRTLVLDLVFNQYFIDTGRSVLGSFTVDMGKSRLVEISSRAGWLFIGNQSFSDLGKAIDFKYWTPYKAYTSGAAKDRIRKFRPILRASESRYSMFVGRDIDFQEKPDMREYAVNGEGSTWGSGATWGAASANPAIWGSTKLIDRASPMSGRGKHTQYRFEKRGVDTPIELYGYIAIYKAGRAR